MWNLLGSAIYLLAASTGLLCGDLTGSEARPRCRRSSSLLQSETQRKKTSTRRMRAMTCHSTVPTTELGSGMLALPTTPPRTCRHVVSCSCALVYFLLSNSFQFSSFWPTLGILLNIFFRVIPHFPPMPLNWQSSPPLSSPIWLPSVTSDVVAVHPLLAVIAAQICTC